MTTEMQTADVLELARTLVARPSQQTDRMEAEPEVQSFIRDCAAPMLDKLGLKGTFDSMGNWTGRVGSGGPCLLFVTYAMTHPGAAMTDPFAPRMIDGPDGPALRGRGAAEQKGAMAAAFAALATHIKHGVNGGEIVLAVSSAGETGRHDAIKAILAGLHRKPDIAILALGTGERISLGNKGRIDFDVVVRGRSAHSSTPWLAVDAIAGARRAMDALDRVEMPAREHPALGRATLTSNYIHTGPRATHTIQDLVKVTYDRRLLPGERPDEGLAAVRAALAKLDGPQTFSVEEGPFMYPAEIAETGRLVTLIRDAHTAAGLEQPGTLHSHGALDAGYLIEHGTEATMWGPGAMELFHTENENVPVAALMKVARGYHAVLDQLGKLPA